MKRIVISAFLGAAISSSAFAAQVEDGNDLPKLAIIGQEAEAASKNPETPLKIAKDQTLDDFYGRNRKLKSKPVSAAPATQKEKPVAERNVYEEVPLPPTAREDDFGGQVAVPEVVQKAVMSRSDVNRIVCSEPVKDVIYSEEKGVMSKFYGNSAYVKFNFDEVGGAVAYNENPIELHVICGETTYTLVAVPLPVPPQIIRLGSDKAAKVRENASMFKDSTTNKQIRELMVRAYKNDYPESFTVRKYSTPIYIYRDLDIVHARTTVVEGEGVSVKEFHVISKVAGIELKEKHFMRRELSDHLGAIAIEPGKEKPKKGEAVRVFVVEFKAETTSEEAANVK